MSALNAERWALNNFQRRIGSVIAVALLASTVAACESRAEREARADRERIAEIAREDAELDRQDRARAVEAERANEATRKASASGEASGSTTESSRSSPGGEPMAYHQALAKSQVENLLQDPSSAKFKNLVAYKLRPSGAYVFCGLVNSKNSYGAYTGNEKFLAGATVAAIDDGSQEFSSLRAEMCSGEPLTVLFF